MSAENKKYIYDQKDWPRFNWAEKKIAEKLTLLRHRQGRLIGRMEGLGFNFRFQAMLQSLTEEVLKTNEIEGEKLDREQVRSSLARQLGMEVGALTKSDRNIDGVVKMMLDATQKYSSPLSEGRLFGWHALLFPSARSGMNKIRVGNWRDDKEGPMQVVSGRMGKAKVHFEAPKAAVLQKEMKLFLSWFNSKNTMDGVLKAAIAHLWFVTLHPFDDGNGRIARAIADLCLARSEDTPQRFYSMSSQISLERNKYYEVLESTQRGSLDITSWLVWFLDCLGRAFEGAETVLSSVLIKANFWEENKDQELNERQRKVINRLFDGFEGKLTSSKWASLAKCSQDSASRDISDLLAKNILIKNPGGGRSTSYSLKLKS